MENLNNAGAEVPYGVNMSDYGHAVGNSMMALMTALEARGDGERRLPLHHSSYSSFHPPPAPADCLVSAAAMFQAEKLQRRPVSTLIEHQLLSAHPVSSVPFVKTEEGCRYPPSRIQFHREPPVYSYAETESTHLASPTVTSFGSQGREIESRHFSISTSSAVKEEETEALKVKISAHPKYRSLLEAYIHCQKVGAPPDVVARLDSIANEYENRQSRTTINVGMDPELDRFMEAYHEMLIKHEEELSKPFKEAMAFFKKIENQLGSITEGTIRISPSAESDEKTEGGGSSDEGDGECGTGEMEFEEVDHHSQDRELKDRLLRKYSGYLSSLKQEFMKKKKKGKLPKDARQKLFDWWTLHNKWPYPSETEKVALAEYTGLDQKQINNWFINQRKRHWKPNDESHSQYVVMESHAPHRNAFYVERHLIPEGSAFHLDC